MCKKLIIALFAIATLIGFSGCTTDADTVNENLNKSAETFEVSRKIVFINGITDKYLATIEGRCSIERDGDKMQAICKIGEGQFTRDEIGLSDNVTYMVLQEKPVAVDDFRKRVILKPESVVPDFDVQTR